MKIKATEFSKSMIDFHEWDNIFDFYECAAKMLLAPGVLLESFQPIFFLPGENVACDMWIILHIYIH